MTLKLKITLAGLITAALLAGAAGFVLGRYYSDNKKPNFTKDYVLYVHPDMSVRTVLDSLQTGAGTLRPKSLERAFAKMEVAQKMKPGRYVIDPSNVSMYVARMLVFGWQTPQKLTLSGTMRSKGSIAKKISLLLLIFAHNPCP